MGTRLRFSIFLIHGLLLVWAVCGVDDEFADFAEFDEEEFDVHPQKTNDKDVIQESSQPLEHDDTQGDETDEAIVEVEEPFDEYDAEEFDGGKPDTVASSPKSSQKEELTFAKVPAGLRRNWASYYVELSVMFSMLIYFLAFLLGRTKNSTLAQAWYKANASLLRSNFAIVGDDGQNSEPSSGVLMKESDHSYVMWCSGRIGVEGMLVQLKLVKRQDLVNFLQRMVKPYTDQLIVKVTMEKEDMDNFIFCFAQKKSAVKLHKDMNDLSLYVESKKKGEDYGLPSSYQMLSEIGEATRTFASDAKLQAFMEKYEGAIEYVHFSDQYSGEKVADDSSEKKLPETSKSIVFCFNLGKKGQLNSKDFSVTEEWMKLVLYFVDKSRKYKMSKEGKAKSDKNRQRVQDSYNKLAHQQRTEQAQLRREEKMKAETEKYMNEEDPVKARKLEEKRLKREQSKKMQKMKAVKIKSL